MTQIRLCADTPTPSQRTLQTPKMLNSRGFPATNNVFHKWQILVAVIYPTDKIKQKISEHGVTLLIK